MCTSFFSTWKCALRLLILFSDSICVWTWTILIVWYIYKTIISAIVCDEIKKFSIVVVLQTQIFLHIWFNYDTIYLHHANDGTLMILIRKFNLQIKDQSRIDCTYVQCIPYLCLYSEACTKCCWRSRYGPVDHSAYALQRELQCRLSNLIE